MEFYRTDKSQLIEVINLQPSWFHCIITIYHWYYIINIITDIISLILYHYESGLFECLIFNLNSNMNLGFFRKIIWIWIWIFFLKYFIFEFEFESNLNIIDMIVLSHIHVLIHLLSVCESWFYWILREKIRFLLVKIQIQTFN